MMRNTDKVHIPKMARLLCAMLALTLCRGVLCLAATQEEGQVISSSYIIRSLSTNIGTVNARMSGTSNDNDFRAEADVNINLWFFGFSLKSIETTSIRAGRVVRYRKTIDTGGHRREITGEVAGDTLTVLVQDRSKSEHKNIPLGDYDITNMEYPEVSLVPGETRRMRVMDLENAEVVERLYRYVKEEKTIFEGKEEKVIVADFTDKNAECRRWTSVINGLPIVLRQDGKEKTGFFNPSYSVRQTPKTAH